ncbi:MAG: hypothetical protein PHO85_01465 [Candidatus Cloacimonetes bacterium]|jgi:hypothetical protein|nr:hypothetical protein [Candidatus Cloacimonadota bacterium]MDD2507105.1 hypothetical protein [Candidatus Cloacimonadota bacterium]MDD4147169.1 hypothetical protein [Candidatus Cloacimonadota bacterium]MDD4560584.1 hypothetical protein [Candidatus Cloacimonadota bacterium]
MRKLSLFIVLFICSFLFAQIQVLPDIEVSGESQVKIFLYKKALPYSNDSLMNDSLRTYLPESLPVMTAKTTSDKAPELQHYIHAQASSRMKLDADYKYSPDHESISSLGIAMSLYAPKSDYVSSHFQGSGAFRLISGEDVALDLIRLDAEGKSLNSKYLAAELYIFKDRYSFKHFDLNRMSNTFGIDLLDQRNQSLEREHSSANFVHSSVLSFPDFDWGNRGYFHTGRSSWHSYAEFDVTNFDKGSMHLMYDGRHFIPAPGFNLRYITDYDQQLSIVNSPSIQINPYAGVLRAYRWIYIPSKPKHTLIPLDFSIRLEDVLPVSTESFLRSFAVVNNSQYRINDALLTDSNNPKIPMSYYDDVFINTSTIHAGFGQGRVVFDQSLKLSLAYLAQQDWIRKPYNSLLQAESAFSFNQYPYSLSVSMNQYYFSVDHLQQDMKEVFDLSFEGAYEIERFSKLYLRCENVLNSDIRAFNNLPRQGVSIKAGIYHRF